MIINKKQWGKPGGGAPLIDPNTGKKFTKISGQVWYDTLGVQPDERVKSDGKRRTLISIEEQKQQIEFEKERRRKEKLWAVSASGTDVSSWINNFEGIHFLIENLLYFFEII